MDALTMTHADRALLSRDIRFSGNMRKLEGESVMKIDAIKLGLAAAIVIAVFWAICSALFSLMPGGMMQMRGQMVHADLGNMPWFLTWSGLFIGLLVWPVISGVIAWAIAAVYNRLIG